MKDLTNTMDITMREQEGEVAEEFPGEAEAKRASLAEERARQEQSASATGEGSSKVNIGPTGVPAPSVADTVESDKFSTASTLFPEKASSSPTPSTSVSGTSTPRRQQGIPLRQAIMDKTEEEAQLNAAGLTEEEKELRKKEKKKGGLSKAQREELAAYERERAKVRQERVDTLAKKLIDRISVWTETGKEADVTKAFQEKTRLEVENLKMESFGLDILHAIGTTYMQKATALIKSQKFLGIGGFFSRLKDKGTLAKETWNTISSAIDAQMRRRASTNAESQARSSPLHGEAANLRSRAC
jgi:hypothetical protein